MQVLVLGINHKTAALETREKMAFADKHKDQAYQYLAASEAVKESVILSTCNRTEIYARVEDVDAGRAALITMLEEVRGATFEELKNCIYYYSGCEAVTHILRVTAGLDSMILGETQIQGQVRDAYEKAKQAGAVDKALHGLFQQAAKCAKRVQTETRINHNSVSVSYLAVEMIKKELGCFDDLTVLVIGAGKMSRLTLQHLHDLGVKDIRVTSRTYQRAKDLAHFFNGQTIDFSRKEETLSAIDIMISSTGAPHLILRREDVEQIMARRNNRPLFVIDIAVPRDIDPAVGELKNVYLFDMDSLQQAVAENQQEREKEAWAAKDMIVEESDEFQAWFKTLSIAPVIKALREKADAVRQAETERVLGSKLSRLSDKEKQVVENMGKSIMNAILKDPILKMKSTAVRESEDFHLECLLYLFDLHQEFESSKVEAEDRGDK